MNHRSFALLCSLTALFTMPVSAQKETEPTFNPIIPDFIADPSAVMFDGVFYMYATTDIDHGLTEMGPPVVWKSTDFVHWSFQGILVPQIEWNKPYEFVTAQGAKKTGYFRYWAPGKAIKKDGKYYLFPTIVKPDENMGTYVMVADRPEGPFRFTNGTGVYFNDSTKIATEAKPLIGDIDGEPFMDQDGQAYIVWRRRFASKMSSDFSKLEGPTITVPTKFSGYSEGPLMFKRKGLYYYIYTLAGNSNYCNGYMMSRNGPLGPFENPEGSNVFIYSSIANNVWGPGHGNVFQMPGTDDFYFQYLEYGEGSTTRQVFVNKMEFNPDGTIVPLIPNRKGVGYLAPTSEKRTNLALNATATASSQKEPRKVTAPVIANPNELPTLSVNTRGGETAERTFTFLPQNAIDGSNGTRWMAGNNDEKPWFMLDLGASKKVNQCNMFFTLPTFGTSWILEKSKDGVKWTVCGTQETLYIASPHTVKNIGKTRYLRVTITKGSAGIWEISVY